ncbi:regulatory protein, arsR family [Methanolobus vulcani]|jgi:Bacterial regulatory protein, arsR family.|uniref:Regulatory protein, arsR family n=1 Tax=Methanolobus vulcani TaxID=38026 RepID=A0A7Z7FC54_9EURY|nr:winged helix-turn-helix domain-containing protein [Methanolobus vulcani]SDF66701.1 regulatory protein, arsR family [Methanolobus vulcani]
MSEKENSTKKHEWLNRLEKEGRLKANPTEDHKIGLQTMQNPTRRKILKMLNGCPLCIEEIRNSLNLNSSMTKFHVEMLENALYVDRVVDSEPLMYQISPRGEAFLENVEET